MFGYHISLLRMLIAAIVSTVIGAFWYSPVLFGKRWEKLSKVKNKWSGLGMGITFLNTLIMAYILAHFIAFSAVKNAFGGAAVGLFAWLGFIATVSMGSVLWEKKPVSLYVLNNSYNLLNMAIMGAIIAL